MLKDRSSAPVTVVVIDDDEAVRDALDGMLRSVGLRAVSFESTQAYLERAQAEDPACIILDIRMPGRSGLDFQADLVKAGVETPIIIISGYADIPMSVRAMKAGAVEFFTKPVRAQELLDAVQNSVAADRIRRAARGNITMLRSNFATLTEREREVFGLVAQGLMNKQIASTLGLSEATIKLHRGSVMRKMQARTLADLVRMADVLTPPR